MQTIINYTVIPRKVKYARLKFEAGQLFAIVPHKKPELAEEMIAKHQKWVMARFAEWRSRSKTLNGITLNERSHWDTQLIIEHMVSTGAKQLNVIPKKISYRTMKRRWGSCSGRGELVFNWHLRHLPDHLIGYVVYHELCHLLALNHGPRFKKLMESQFGDLKQFDNELTTYWHKIHKK